MDRFKEATEKYVTAAKKYREFISQFMNVSWVEDNVNNQKRPLVKDDFKKIKLLKKELDDAHDEWFRLLNV